MTFLQDSIDVEKRNNTASMNLGKKYILCCNLPKNSIFDAVISCCQQNFQTDALFECSPVQSLKAIP